VTASGDRDGDPQAARVLLGSTGLSIDGGVASVSRCIARALDEAIDGVRVARADRVLLYDDPGRPPAGPRRGRQRFARGRQPLFAVLLWMELLGRRPDLVLLDQVGLARSLQLPLPGPSRRYAIFCHGIELGRARESAAHGRALRGAWRLLANSQHTARYLREHFPELAERVRVVPLCIDPRRSERWERSPLAPPGTREPAALIVGRIWSEERGKGHDALLEAWPAVRARHPRGRGSRRARARSDWARRSASSDASPTTSCTSAVCAPACSSCRAGRRASASSTPRPCGTGSPASVRRPTPPVR